MQRGIAGAVALLAGFAMMSLELTAVRLLAPYFGDSAPVWTNVIGVMLVALTAGAWIGGRWADGPRAGVRLVAVFTLAGIWTAVVPLLARPVGVWLLPQELPLDGAMWALVLGSMTASLGLFAPPVAMIGCVTPMLVAALVRGGGHVGRSSGWVAAWSTLGSLLGTFATTHALVPYLGSRATVWLCAGAVLLCAALVAGSRRRGALCLLPLGLAIAPWGPLRGVGPGQELVAEVESAYQYLQVVREPRDGAATTVLKINEGLDSFHSVAIEGTALTGGCYYDYFAAAPLLVGDGEVPTPLRILSLGAAAGTFSRLFNAMFPGCVVDGVEIDPAVVALGAAHFGGRPAAGRIFAGLDARVCVERIAGPYEVVVVDAYERQIYVPAHVASVEFFEAVQRRLRVGGVVAVNSGGHRFDDPVVTSIARTMAVVFGESWAFRVPRSRNFVLLARHAGTIDQGALALERAPRPELVGVLEAMGYSGAWRRFEPGADAAAPGTVLRDDRPVLDSLLHATLTADLGLGGGADRLTPMAGAGDPATVLRGARSQLLDERDYEGAYAALAAASRPTAELRLLAGDLRWYLHDLRGARAEYRGAVARAPSEELREFAAQKVALATAEIELRGLDQAAATTRRNGWLALGAALVLLVAGGLALRG